MLNCTVCRIQNIWTLNIKKECEKKEVQEMKQEDNITNICFKDEINFITFLPSSKSNTMGLLSLDRKRYYHALNLRNGNALMRN
jgi:tRNA U34 2-thiouridine synthase MnmA/TrmU